jgi:hypothetical protein
MPAKAVITAALQHPINYARPAFFFLKIIY